MPDATNYGKTLINSQAEGEPIGLAAGVHKSSQVFYSHFEQMVILEVISDPKIITSEKIQYWTKILKISLNWMTEYLSVSDKNEKKVQHVLPRNTVIAQKKLTGQTTYTPPVFAFPFFPSHLSMPCKPGELVWVMYEKPASSGEKIPYWMCSVVQPYFVDDVNHTHAPMALRNSLVPKRAPANLKIPYQLRNGSINLLEKQGKFVDEHNQPLITSLSETKFLHSDDPKIFENLITITDAAKLSVYEVVPRFHKRPGDVVLEGSNNSLIVLGTDRNSRLGNYFLSESKNKAKAESIGLSASKTETDFRHYAGSIDMVVGRGYSLNTGGQSVDVTSISNNKDIIKSELDKFNLSQEEGNHDFTNDRSRILISQKTSTDINFNLSSYFNDPKLPAAPKNILDSPRGDSSIVIKSDKIRLIARSDISFIVTNFDDKTLEREKKEKYKNESDDKKKWASITIRRNGDIIFSPSDKGVIKLGGDDADKAILCTDNLSAKPINNEGTVTFKPGIISTGADLIGTGRPKKGTFATKILVK